MKFSGLIFVIAGVLFAHYLTAGKHGPIAQITPSLPEAKVDTPQAHRIIIDSFAKAEAAVIEGDGNALMASAKVLEDLGAKPLAGTENAAELWALKASNTAGFEPDNTARYRGRVKGPAYRRQQVLAGSSDEIIEIYYAAEPAVMTLSPSKNGALNWEVIETDASGEPVCSTEPIEEIQTCNFTPLWTGQYRIKITNNSTQDVTYIFVTN